MLSRALPVLTALLPVLFLWHATALAADLHLDFDKYSNSFSLTNNLSSPVYVLYLEGSNDERIPVHRAIEPGKAINVPLGELILPDRLPGAACTFQGAPPNGIVRGKDGKFHLSVDPA